MDIRIEYHVYGVASDETLVLLHPGGTLHSIWLPFIRHWSDKRRVIAFDIYPPDVDAVWGLSDVSTVIVDSLRELGVVKFHLLGASMGANLALHIALQAPDMICSLVLDSAQVGSSNPPKALIRLFNILEFLVRFVPSFMIEGFLLRQFKHMDAQDLKAVQKELERAGKFTFVRHVKLSIRHDVSDRLDDIGMPTLILAGENDMLTKSGEHQRLQSHIKHAQMIIVPDAGHVTFLAQSNLFLSFVDRFLGEVAVYK